MLVTPNQSGENTPEKSDTHLIEGVDQRGYVGHILLGKQQQQHVILCGLE
jgi:hypothetical protein